MDSATHSALRISHATSPSCAPHPAGRLVRRSQHPGVGGDRLWKFTHRHGHPASAGPLRRRRLRRQSNGRQAAADRRSGPVVCRRIHRQWLRRRRTPVHRPHHRRQRSLHRSRRISLPVGRSADLRCRAWRKARGRSHLPECRDRAVHRSGSLQPGHSLNPDRRQRGHLRRSRVCALAIPLRRRESGRKFHQPRRPAKRGCHGLCAGGHYRWLQPRAVLRIQRVLSGAEDRFARQPAQRMHRLFCRRKHLQRALCCDHLGRRRRPQQHVRRGAQPMSPASSRSPPAVRRLRLCSPLRRPTGLFS